MVRSFPVILLLCLYSNGGLAQANSFKGVFPKNLAKYQEAEKNGKFTCIDGSNQISFDRVNDDICDCSDGSDEPGTAACENGQFYCVNSPYRPGVIPSWKVNDGVCEPECCDGSDEYDGKIKCPDTCADLQKAWEDEQQRLAEIRKMGAQTRYGYIQKAIKERPLEAAALEALKSKPEELKAELEKTRTLLNELRTLEEQAEDAKLNAEANLKRKYESSPFFAMRSKLKECKNSHEDLRFKVERLRADISQLREILKDLSNNHQNNDNAVQEAIEKFEEFDVMNDYDKSEPELAEEDDLEWGKQSNWKELEITEKDFQAKFVEANKTLTEKIYEWMGIQTDPASSIKSIIAQKLKQEGYKDVDSVRDREIELDQQLTETVEEVEYKTASLTRDYGPEQEFWALEGRCLEKTFDFYNYKFCWFRGVNQGGVNIGKWDSWDLSKNDDSKYLKMFYRNGEACWNGKERTLEVTLECGVDEELLEISEPSSCQYVAKVITAALCTPIKAEEKIKDEL